MGLLTILDSQEFESGSDNSEFELDFAVSLGGEQPRDVLFDIARASPSDALSRFETSSV